jgi:hypothetical protein
MKVAVNWVCVVCVLSGPCQLGRVCLWPRRLQCSQPFSMSVSVSVSVSCVCVGQAPTVLTALLQVDVHCVYACFICVSGVGFVAGILQVKSLSNVVM